MDQAKNYVCRSCSTPVPMGHKFCGRCGAAIPPEILNARTQFFGQLQVPGKAKLILIRGEGVEGLSYQLNAEQHVVGRNGQLVFPDDPFVSPQHANFFYRERQARRARRGLAQRRLLARARHASTSRPGDYFLAGEQLFRIEGPPRPNDGPAPDGTYFYSSPKHQTHVPHHADPPGRRRRAWRCARAAPSLQIGREGGDLNFPSDLYMSASHCKLEEHGGKLTLTDLNSRNGTYVRLKAERELGPRRLPLHRAQAAARRDHRELSARRSPASPRLGEAAARSRDRRAHERVEAPTRRQAVDDRLEVERARRCAGSISNSSAKRS